MSERSPAAPRSGTRAPRWLLPAELAESDPTRPRPRRTLRDWAVDLLLFTGAVLVGLDEWARQPAYYAQAVPQWMLTVDPWVGAVACLALWWRRRFPLALAIALVPALLVAGTATGASMVAVFTAAIRRDWLPASLVTLAYLVPTLHFAAQYPPPGMSTSGALTVVAMMFLAPLGWGMATRARRQLILGLRRDAQRQRQEHRRRLADTRRAERERIAREMHDVLAHRISLLSVHAGGLAYRTAQAQAGTGQPLTPDELRAATEVIRDTAAQALDELGEVLAVLRAAGPQDVAAAPQPRLSDIGRLVAEARAADQRVNLEMVCAPGTAEALRPATQRTVYRTVQEGLTNARKHAPGTPVAVRVEAAPGPGVAVTVSNPMPPGAGGGPGAGTGLIGLAERVALDGGTLEHAVADESFRLTVRLSWPA